MKFLVEEKEDKCVICGNEIIGYGNNAAPVKDGKCCDNCNKKVVIPARFKKINNEPEEKKLNELYRDEYENPRRIKVSPNAASYVRDIEGQLSDGYWENSPRMEGYWKFFYVDGDDIVIAGNWDEYDKYSRRGFTSNLFKKMSNDAIKNFFADKIKFMVKAELKDNNQDPIVNWNRDSDYELDYLHGTIADAYKAYDELKGRKLREDYNSNYDFEDLFWWIYGDEDPLNLRVRFDKTNELIDEKYADIIWPDSDANGDLSNLSNEAKQEIINSARQEALSWRNYDIYNMGARYVDSLTLYKGLKQLLGVECNKLTESINLDEALGLKEDKDSEGWFEDVDLYDVEGSGVIDDLDSFIYEIKNAVKGTYTGAHTYKELANYIEKTLIEDLGYFAESIKHIPENSINESLTEDSNIDYKLAYTKLDKFMDDSEEAINDFYSAKNISELVDVLNSYIIDEERFYSYAGKDATIDGFAKYILDNNLNESLHNDEISDFFDKAKRLGVKTLGDLRKLLNEDPASVGNTEKEKMDNYSAEANPENKELSNEELKENLNKEDLEQQIRKAIRQYFSHYDDNDYRDLIDDYLEVEIEDQDDRTKVEVRAELTYNTLDKLADRLNPLVQQYDEDAYFDHEDSGIINAFIRKNAKGKKIIVESLDKMQNIKIPGYLDTWSAFDDMKINVTPTKTSHYYIMENDDWGDETFYLVITPDFKNIYETYDDIETCLIDEGIIDPSLKLDMSRKAQLDPLDDSNTNENLKDSTIKEQLEQTEDPKKQEEIKTEIEQAEREFDRASDSNNPQGEIEAADKLNKLYEDDEEDKIDTLYHDASEDELKKMGAFDNLNDELYFHDNVSIDYIPREFKDVDIIEDDIPAADIDKLSNMAMEEQRKHIKENINSEIATPVLNEQTLEDFSKSDDEEIVDYTSPNAVNEDMKPQKVDLNNI